MGNFCCCCFAKGKESNTYKQGYSKVEGADFDYQFNQGLKKYGHMIRDSLDDVTSVHGKPKDNKTHSTSSSNSENFDTAKLLADSLDEKYQEKHNQKSSSKDSLEYSDNISSDAKSTEYFSPSVTAKSESPQPSTSLFDINYLDAQTSAIQFTQTAESTLADGGQSIPSAFANKSQSKKSKPVRVRANLHHFSSDEDEDKSRMNNVVKDLGAEGYTYIKRNGRKVIVIKDRGGTSFLFLGKNRFK